MEAEDKESFAGDLMAYLLPMLLTLGAVMNDGFENHHGLGRCAWLHTTRGGGTRSGLESEEFKKILMEAIKIEEEVKKIKALLALPGGIEKAIQFSADFECSTAGLPAGSSEMTWFEHQEVRFLNSHD